MSSEKECKQGNEVFASSENPVVNVKCVFFIMTEMLWLAFIDHLTIFLCFYLLSSHEEILSSLHLVIVQHVFYILIP
jgi:hypothetical protein